MGDIEFLVAETYKHFYDNFPQGRVDAGVFEEVSDPMDEIPAGPGLLYHIQKSFSIFVVRTFVSKNIRKDFKGVQERPEDYPSLRLIERGEAKAQEIRYFITENPFQAEVIHDHLCNRRIPMDEESLCNLSDPGFSWWLTKRETGFHLAFTLSVGSDDETVKLGPLGDQQLALKKFQEFERVLTEAGLALNIENEIRGVRFSEGEDFLLEELKELFEFGVISDGITKLFKILSLQVKDLAALETLWFYLQEIAAMRRFWIQIQYDLV